jgi:hypothetical protein
MTTFSAHLAALDLVDNGVVADTRKAVGGPARSTR